MATNYESLKTAYQAKIADITDNDIQKYEALAVLDQYIAALTKQAETVANDVTSYSINGRSVTRSAGGSMQSQVASLKGQLNNLIWGNVTMSDMRLTQELGV